MFRHDDFLDEVRDVRLSGSMFGGVLILWPENETVLGEAIVRAVFEATR